MSTVVILACGIAIVVCAPLVQRARRGALDPFEPIFLFALAWGAMFVVRPLAIVVRDDTDFYGVDIRGSLDSAVLLGLLGACGFVCGYHTRLGARVAARLGEPRERAARSIVLRAWVVAALAGLAVVVLFRIAGLDGLRVFLGGRSRELDDLIEGSSVYAWWGSQLITPAALATFAAAWVTRDRWAIASATVLGALVALRAIPTGNRIVMLIGVGAVIVFLYLRADRRPGLTALVALLVIACVASGALLAFRYPESRSDAGAALRNLSPIQALRPITRGPDGEMAPALAGALTVVPSQLGFRYGRVTFGELPLRAVPRVWWEDKPKPPQTTIVEAVWPGAVPYGFNPAFTPVLSFYWDFGLGGVFGGMFLYGVLARAAYSWLLRFARCLGAQMVYATYALFLIVLLRTDPVMSFVQFILFVVPVAWILGALPGASRSREIVTAPTTTGDARR